MHLENPAHFRSFTKTGGLEIAPRMTHQQSAPGVQSEHDLKMTSGDIVQLHVSENMQLGVKLCLCDERVGHLYFRLLCLWAATDKWIKNLATGTYYQLNVQSVLTWFQAEKSCKQQGASLLSVSDPHQQAFVSGRIPPGHILAEKLFCPTEHR